jgi:hypothetical protein
MIKIPAAVLLLFLLAACGGTEDPAPASEPAAGTSSGPRLSPSAGPADDADAGLRAAVQAYSDAYLTGDGPAAWALLSARCRDRTDRVGYVALVEQAGQMYGSALELESFDAEVSGDLARATYTYSVPAINQDREPWVRESGEWRTDDC